MTFTSWHDNKAQEDLHEKSRTISVLLEICLVCRFSLTANHVFENSDPVQNILKTTEYSDCRLA